MEWSAVEGDPSGAICGGDQLNDCYLVCDSGYGCTGDCVAKCNYGVYEDDHVQQCDLKPTVTPSYTTTVPPRETITFSGQPLSTTHFCFVLGDDTSIATPVCAIGACTVGTMATNVSSTAVAGRGYDTLKVAPCCDYGLNTCVLEGDLTTISYDLDYTVCLACEFMYKTPDDKFVYDCESSDGTTHTRIEDVALNGTSTCPAP